MKLANSKVEVVRFLCIDTPEVHHPRLGLQLFGLEGAAFTAKYAPVRKEVELEMDVGDRDKFKRKDTVEIGYSFSNEVVGRGLATEAVSSLVFKLFDEFNVHRIQANLDARNTASQKLCERIGMRKEAHFIQDFWSENEWTDSLVYGMLSSDLK
ncbi:GNAT family N-acetyltransferase [Bacillus nitratireducens]|uniref:GNAT family N-acetyltransferase n=1 Tax=Bacillus nitratireducens TaxID=2026193 RepID=UPI0028CB9784|nr:GNAT family N-acetyltransferase [Bacillus nitratireducens]